MNNSRFQIISSESSNIPISRRVEPVKNGFKEVEFTVQEKGQKEIEQISSKAQELKDQVLISKLKLDEEVITSLAHISELIVTTTLEMNKLHMNNQATSIATFENYLQVLISANKTEETKVALQGLVELFKHNESSKITQFENRLLEKCIDVLSTVVLH